MSSNGFTGFAEADFARSLHTGWRQRLRHELLRELKRHMGEVSWSLHSPRGRSGMYLDAGGPHCEARPGFWLGLDSQEVSLCLRVGRQAGAVAESDGAWHRFAFEVRRPSSDVQQHVIASLRQGYLVELYGQDARPFAVVGPTASSRALISALSVLPAQDAIQLRITRRWPRSEAIERGTRLVLDLVESVAWLLPLLMFTVDTAHPGH